MVFTRRAHDLTQSNTDSLSPVGVVRVQAVLQDWDQLWQHLLTELPHNVTERTCRHLVNTNTTTHILVLSHYVFNICFVFLVLTT